MSPEMKSLVVKNGNNISFKFLKNERVLKQLKGESTDCSISNMLGYLSKSIGRSVLSTKVFYFLFMSRNTAMVKTENKVLWHSNQKYQYDSHVSV